MKDKNKTKFWTIATVVLVLTFLAGGFASGIVRPSMTMEEMREGMSMGDMREDFISIKEYIQGDLLPQGKYRCCLENPCTYCIEKTPGHGEGATCDCLSDIMNGVHPCGECIGEILEGHGNPFLSKYFATAISHKVGEQHLPTLKQIISEKYEISTDEQI